MRIIGLDPSLARTGVGIIEYSGFARAEIVESKGRRGDSLEMRDARIGDIVSGVMAFVVHSTALVVIESGAYAAVGGSAWDRAGLWWRLVENLHRRDVPVVTVAPTTLKKWAANSGRADKSDVAVAMARLWPAVEAPSNDAWDGLALATMGAQGIGWQVPSRAHHAESVGKVDWSVAVAA